jgi:hypothetical protein
MTMDLISSMASERLRARASASSKATHPVTAGLAMLVPDIRVVPFVDRDAAADTLWPGAETSGFCRPSRVGPALENHESGLAGLWAS